jgi:hypothetical protein
MRGVKVKTHQSPREVVLGTVSISYRAGGLLRVAVQKRTSLVGARMLLPRLAKVNSLRRAVLAATTRANPSLWL